MGRYSEWALAFRGPNEQIEKLLIFIKSSSAFPKREDYESDTSYRYEFDVANMIQMVNAAVEDSMEDYGVGKNGTRKIIISDESKCYGPWWGDAIRRILNLARTGLGIKASYVKIGEEVQDITLDNDLDLEFRVARWIEDP